MKRLRVYLDTSVIGGCFDQEFTEASNMLFDSFNSLLYIPIISDVTFDELEKAPDKVKDKVRSLNNIEMVNATEQMRTLAKSYLQDNIISNRYSDDALHIAIATVVNVDVLVSWNFKHIVNLDKIRKFNAVNLKEGYKPLEIRTPREVINDV